MSFKELIEDRCFIQFYNVAYSANPEELSSHIIESDMIEKLSITSDFEQGQGKEITITLKNPRNIFNADVSNNNTNIFGDSIMTSDWIDYIVPDGQFFVGKGTYADWILQTDAGKTKRLMGIFRINRVISQMIKQTLTINGQDLMKYPMRGVAYSNTDEVWVYPPDNWASVTDVDGDLMSVGQIVHDVFHKMGVWHYHKDGTINNDSGGSLVPDGTIFYSTNMYFSPAVERADEQIFNLIHPYDFIKTFSNYTGYKLYINEKVISGTPRAVFYFAPPDYTDGTVELFAVSEILYHNEPTSTHATPILITDISYGRDDNDIRGYISTTTADSHSMAENSGDSGKLMRNKRWMLGVIKEPDIHEVDDSGTKLYSSEIMGQAVMTQIMHLYRHLNIAFTNWIKFQPQKYNMGIFREIINLQIDAYYFCKSVSWNYSKGRFTTTADFSFFNLDAIPKPSPQFSYAWGDGSISIFITQTGADSYKVYIGGILKETIVPTNDLYIYRVYTGYVNGTAYNLQIGAIYGSVEKSSPIYSVTPNPNDNTGGGGRVHCE